MLYRKLTLEYIYCVLKILNNGNPLLLYLDGCYMTANYDNKVSYIYSK